MAAAALVSQAVQASVKKDSNIDDDFSKYMEEMQALGAI